MSILNIEFKAKVNDLRTLENKLLLLNPRYVGVDNQTDSYFNVEKGRLKLREGNIENSLIYYERQDIKGIKQSDIILYSHVPGKALKDILIKVHGIKVVVSKTRKIYFLENVKFHFDTVEGLGSFIEVEAIDTNGNIGSEKLKEQCDHYKSFFDIPENDFISESYSDLIMKNILSQKL